MYAQTPLDQLAVELNASFARAMEPAIVAINEGLREAVTRMLRESVIEPLDLRAVTNLWIRPR